MNDCRVTTWGNEETSFSWSRATRYILSSSTRSPSHAFQSTAHTLCCTFALLAVYPEEQEAVFQEVRKHIYPGQFAAARPLHGMRKDVTVNEEPQFSGETFEQRKARVLSSRSGLTLTPNRVPLTFTRR
ncbi:614/534 cytochrome P450 [Coprinopsis cinerea AmutBmut pab1-1]|nr:614/534 cytochrome P450 [Coprinopsis cinerea AmutBmut pab1-1]